MEDIRGNIKYFWPKKLQSTVKLSQNFDEIETENKLKTKPK